MKSGESMNRKLSYILFFVLFVLSNLSFAQYQKVNSMGLDIYYRIFGEGQPILIIGGGPGDLSDRYLSLCDVLSPQFQCILVEQRGCGKSAPEVYDSTTVSVALTLQDFEMIREQLGIEQWNVLGFSYGGYLASIYAHFYPCSISSLLLMDSMGLNPNMFAYFLDNIFSRLSLSDKALIEYWSDSTRVANDQQHAITEKIRAMMPGYFYDRKKSLLVSEVIKDSDFNFKLGNWIWTDIINRNLDLVEMRCNYNGPVLILHGRQDPVGESVPQQLSNYYKNSKLIFVEKAGHYSWIEQPEIIFTNIKEFLQVSD